jgi:hypothetical protein
MIEAEILAEIDKRVYGSEGIGRQNPIALWVCLWTLILSYKDQRIFLNFWVPSGKGKVLIFLLFYIPSFYIVHFVAVHS